MSWRNSKIKKYTPKNTWEIIGKNNKKRNYTNYNDKYYSKEDKKILLKEKDLVKKEKDIIVPNIFNAVLNFKKKFGKIYIIKLIEDIVDITVNNSFFTHNDFNVDSIYNTISFLYYTKKTIIDGANAGMTSTDISVYGNRREKIKKKTMERDWISVLNFAKNTKSVVILRNCLLINKRESEKYIDFTKLFKNNALWLICINPAMDDVLVIMLSALISIIRDIPIPYYSNDKYEEHEILISKYCSIFNAKIERKEFSYRFDKGFNVI
tara:strand:+ start:2738 stop:3535 length:798 start_codon:yes stop_codon:yes gene_type:complete